MKEITAGCYFIAAEAADADTVVLLHSSQSASSQWRQLMQQLQGKVNLLAVDLLGYGNAPQPEASAHFRLATEVPRVQQALQAANIQTPVILVGHSYGGALALKLATEGAVAVSKLALYEPVSFHVLPDDSPGMQEIRTVSDAMHGKDATECTRTFVDYWNQPGYFDALPAKIQGLMVRQAVKVALDFDALLNEPLSLKDYARLQQPLLLMTGEFTRRSAQAVVRSLTTVLTNATVKQVPAGHMGPLTHPAEVNPLIIDFIQ